MKNQQRIVQPEKPEGKAGRALEMIFACLKPRWVYGVALAATIVAGLCSRIFSDSLPVFVSAHFGDALWAAMVYFGFRALVVRKSLLLAALLSLCFSFAIEFSQLYQAEWINDLRQTLLGSLVLGRGFLSSDLIRYTTGIMIAFLFDYFMLQHPFRKASFTTGAKG